MIVNFRVCKIRQDKYKLIQIFILIIIKKSWSKQTAHVRLADLQTQLSLGNIYSFIFRVKNLFLSQFF